MVPSLSSLVTVMVAVFATARIDLSCCEATFSTVEPTSDATYIASGWVDAKPVRLVLDTDKSNIYVRCSVFEQAKCETTKASDVPGSEQGVIHRQSAGTITFVTKRFASVTIGGYTFKDLDVRVVYDSLSYLPPHCDGILGMNYAARNWNSRSVTFGLSLRGQEFSVNEPLSTFIDRVPATTAINGYTAPHRFPWESFVSCVRPMAVKTSSATVEPCLPIDTDRLEELNNVYSLDPAYRGIVLPNASLRAFAATYLTSCTAQMNGIHTEGYLCSNDVASSLPALAFEIDGWSVPVDRYKIASGEGTFVALSDYEAWVPGLRLGAPFFNTVQVYVDTKADTLSIFCTESTCIKARANATSILDSLRNSGGKGSGSPNSTGLNGSTTDVASCLHSSTVFSTLVIGSILFAMS